MAFCRWMSDRLGYAVRLPTEYEWQQAATVGNPENRFPWGPEWNDRLANTDESHLSRTTAVGMYPLGGTGGSPEGIMDMSGNVREWCLNKYDNPEDTAIDDSGKSRVLRGGSWLDSRDDARAGSRGDGRPGLRFGDVGFRLCRASPIR